MCFCKRNFWQKWAVPLKTPVPVIESALDSITSKVSGVSSFHWLSRTISAYFSAQPESIRCRWLQSIFFRFQETKMGYSGLNVLFNRWRSIVFYFFSEDIKVALMFTKFGRAIHTYKHIVPLGSAQCAPLPSRIIPRRANGNADLVNIYWSDTRACLVRKHHYRPSALIKHSGACNGRAENHPWSTRCEMGAWSARPPNRKYATILVSVIWGSGSSKIVRT